MRVFSNPAPAAGPPPQGWRPYAVSLAYTALALAAGLVVSRYFDIAQVGLVFILPVMASAVRFGRWPSLATCVAAAAVYNFFFLPPLYTFFIAKADDTMAFAIFVAVALITSNLAARMRAEAMVAHERAVATDRLYQFSAKLAAVYTLDDLLWATAFQIAQMLKVQVVILLPQDGQLGIRAGYPPDDRMSAADTAAAAWVWQHAESAVHGCAHASDAKRLYLPMRTGRGLVGVIGLESDGVPLRQSEARRLFDALADQAALAIERIVLAEAIEKTRLAAEAEKLRGALLTSISHDLRTPLAVILGAASSLKDLGGALDPAAHHELASTIQDEAERLNRFIANLLDMTRLESGALAPRLEPTDLGDVAGSAAARASRILAGHTLHVAVEPDLPLVRLDPVLFEQALFNLLDNAGKYAPAGTAVTLSARRYGAVVRLDIADEGPGIAPADLERIFDKFYRAQAADAKRASTGLGLAIARGFVEAMGGRLTAANRNEPGRSGAVFTISLPIEAP